MTTPSPKKTPGGARRKRGRPRLDAAGLLLRPYSFMISSSLAEQLTLAKQQMLPETSESAIIRVALTEWFARQRAEIRRKAAAVAARDPAQVAAYNATRQLVKSGALATSPLDATPTLDPQLHRGRQHTTPDASTTPQATTTKPKTTARARGESAETTFAREMLDDAHAIKADPTGDTTQRLLARDAGAQDALRGKPPRGRRR
jgi:hypothetical protein